MANSRKRGLGQYFTREKLWLKENVREFIIQSGCKIAYDPFAGSGDLLAVAKEIGFQKTVGLDIDESMGWAINNSLVNIPHVDGGIIITNPPYLSNYSAKRRRILESSKEYFDNSKYNDLYLIALEKMLKAQDYVVAILPETFINSPFPKERLSSINILEENPFTETETPVCVACFDGRSKPLYEVKVFKNGDFTTTLGQLEEKRLYPMHDVKVKFNTLDGWIGLRAVDTTNPERTIEFMKKESLDYDLSGIKQSSRLITIIDMDVPSSMKDNFIEESNAILKRFRKETDDILLSPFKGNMKNGVRRRRLDFDTCRAILEMAYKSINGTLDVKRYRKVQSSLPDSS